LINSKLNFSSNLVFDALNHTNILVLLAWVSPLISQMDKFSSQRILSERSETQSLVIPLPTFADERENTSYIGSERSERICGA